jgi:hypothetical protein
MNAEDLIRQNKQHIEDVKRIINSFIIGLNDRAKNHDHTKLTTTGTLKLLKALNNNNEEDWNEWKEYHFKQERHHPEFHSSIKSMNLVDLVEMVADGTAAHYRRKGGSFDYDKQVEYFEKKGFSNDLSCILANTFMAMNIIMKLGG